MVMEKLEENYLNENKSIKIIDKIKFLINLSNFVYYYIF